MFRAGPSTGAILNTGPDPIDLPAHIGLDPSGWTPTAWASPPAIRSPKWQ